MTTLICPHCQAADDLEPRTVLDTTAMTWTDEDWWCRNCDSFTTEPIRDEPGESPSERGQREHEAYVEACDRARDHMRDEGTRGTGRLS